MKGYKVFNPDWTCRGYKFEVGQEYTHNRELKLCESGFHFCRKASDCFKFYDFDSRNKVAEVDATGLIESDEVKSVTNKIKIVRELSWYEVLDIVNEGKNCTGLWNTGNWNTGDWNTGFFSTRTPKIDLFDKPTSLNREEILKIKGIQILAWNYENNWWIYSGNMTDKEKKEHPEHEVTGGYIKTVTFKDACGMMWEKLTENEKSEVKNIPNFDAEIFKRITGIEVEG